MTSPVDTSVKFFYNGMPGAPVLNGTAGSIVALLDACLVNGFGSLNVSGINVVGGVATASIAGAFAARPEAVVVIAGATGAWTALNGEQKVTAIGSNTFSFATALPNGSAAGTITAKMAPAGWGHAFAPGTNIRVYRSLDASGTMRPYLRVTDTNALTTRVIGYETMTSNTAGTGLFPTAAQVSGGLSWVKGYNTAAPDPLNWTVVANGKRFQLWIAMGMSPSYGGPTQTGETGAAFGEFNSLKATVDAYNGFIIGGVAGGNLTGGLSLMSWNDANYDCTIARLHTNAAGARFAEYGDGGNYGGYDSGVSPSMGPLNGPMAKLILQNPFLYIDRPNFGPRGYLKEIFHIPQRIPIGQLGFDKGDISQGYGIAAGLKLLAIPGTYNMGINVSGDYKTCTLVDVTGPWD